MNFELHKFKKISENKKSAVLQHPLGHKITIAKNVLSPEVAKQLGSLKLHMAEGGDVTDEELQAEADALPKRSGLAEERVRTHDEDFKPDFPEPKSAQLAQADVAPQEPAGPPAPTQDEAFNQKVQQRFEQLQRQGQVPFDFADKYYQGQGEAEKQQGMKRAQEDILGEMTSEKTQKEAQAAEEVKSKALSQDKMLEHYNHDVAYIKAQNNQRQALGLSPLPLPLPPQAATAVAQTTEAPPAAEPAQQMAPQTIEQPAAAPSVPAGSVPGAPEIQPNDPYGIKTQTNAQMQGYGLQRQGLQGEASAQQKIAEAQQPLLEEGASSLQKAHQDYQTHLNSATAENQAFKDDLANQHIDPNHVLNSMGNGSKFLTGIGLFLGGLGSGFTHTGNQAMEFLKSQIDKDVEAQIKNVGIKENLLSANLKMFPILSQAAEVTRANIAEALKAQMAVTANKYQSPLIQARAQQAIGQIDAEKIAPALRMGAMMGSLSSNAAQDPAAKLRMLGMANIIPQSQQEAAFKELQTAQNMSRQRDNLLAAFDTVNDNNTVFNRVAHLGFTPAKTLAARDPLLAQLVKDSEGRITPTDIDLMKPLFPVPGDAKSTIDFKRQKMAQFIDEKMHYPQLESLGINPKQASRFNEQGQKKFKLGAPVASAK